MATAEQISPKQAVANMMKSLGSIDDPAPSPAAPTPTPVAKTDPAPAQAPAAPAPAAEPAKPVAPALRTAEAAPADDFTKPDPAKPPTNAEKWKKWNEARDAEFKRRDDEAATLKKELESVKQQIADNAKAKPADALSVAELENLKKERDELSAQLSVVGLERHPEFKKKYDAKIEEQLNDIKMVAAGENGDKIVKLLNLPESTWRTDNLKEALAEVDELDRAAVRTAWLNIDKIRRQRESELSTSREEFNRKITEHQLKEKTQQAEAAKQQRSMVDKLFDSNLESLSKKISELSAKKGDEAYNTALQQRLAEAKAILYGEAPPDRVVQAVLSDAAFSQVQSERDNLRVENEKLTAQLESLKGASKIGPTQGAKAPGMSPETAFTRDTTPNKAIRGWVQRLQADPAE